MNERATTAERLQALMGHLGIAEAFFATQIPGDLAGLAQAAPGRIAGLVLVVPTRLDPAPFAAVSDRLLMVAGETGLTVPATERAASRLAGSRRTVLAGYAAAGWSDVALERRDELAEAMTSFLSGLLAGRAGLARAVADSAAEGEHAGLAWRREGSGPPLILTPFFLAASQWAPVLPLLARHFTVIRVGGPHIGGIAALEDRARARTYRDMFTALVDRLEITAGERVLDVGCGSGALDRLLAARLGAGARIDAVDLNPFFLEEAHRLAEKAGCAAAISFRQASATELPFPDAAFDAVFSVTVLEECDADRAIAEMVRVARPGGRVGVVVRAIDLEQWWNLDLPPHILAKAARPPQSVAPGGVADRSLYARMARAGLRAIEAFPAMITLDRADGPIWRYREDPVLAELTPDEAALWHGARQAASDAGVLLQGQVLHAAVGRKPALGPDRATASGPRSSS